MRNHNGYRPTKANGTGRRKPRSGPRSSPPGDDGIQSLQRALDEFDEFSGWDEESFEEPLDDPFLGNEFVDGFAGDVNGESWLGESWLGGGWLGEDWLANEQMDNEQVDDHFEDHFADDSLDHPLSDQTLPGRSLSDQSLPEQPPKRQRRAASQSTHPDDAAAEERPSVGGSFAMAKQLAARATHARRPSAAAQLVAASVPLALMDTPAQLSAPLLAALVRSTATVAKRLHRRRATRPLIARLPWIVRRMAEQVTARQQASRGVTPSLVQALLVRETQRLLNHRASSGRARPPARRATRRGANFATDFQDIEQDTFDDEAMYNHAIDDEVDDEADDEVDEEW